MKSFETIVAEIHNEVWNHNFDGAVVILATAMLDAVHDPEVQAEAFEIITNELQ